MSDSGHQSQATVANKLGCLAVLTAFGALFFAALSIAAFGHCTIASSCADDWRIFAAGAVVCVLIAIVIALVARDYARRDID